MYLMVASLVKLDDQLTLDTMKQKALEERKLGNRSCLIPNHYAEKILSTNQQDLTKL